MATCAAFCASSMSVANYDVDYLLLGFSRRSLIFGGANFSFLGN
jgi:hypothetical protein